MTFIVNIIIGTLEAEKSVKMFLLITEQLDEANYCIVSNLFDKSFYAVTQWYKS